MTPEEMKGLDVGDVVRHVGGADGYVVTGNYGDRVTVVRTQDLTHPAEWILASKARRDEVSPRHPKGCPCTECSYNVLPRLRPLPNSIRCQNWPPTPDGIGRPGHRCILQAVETGQPRHQHRCASGCCVWG